MLAGTNSKSCIRTWVATELVSPGSWDHSSQVRESASFPRSMLRDAANFPKRVWGRSPIRDWVNFLVLEFRPQASSLSSIWMMSWLQKAAQATEVNMVPAHISQTPAWTQVAVQGQGFLGPLLATWTIEPQTQSCHLVPRWLHMPPC